MFIVCLDPRLFWPHQKGLGSILGEPLHKAEITLFHFSLELVLSLGQQCIWISSTGTENFFQLSLSPDYGIPYRLLLTTWPHPRPHQRRPGNEAKVSMCVCVYMHPHADILPSIWGMCSRGSCGKYHVQLQRGQWRAKLCQWSLPEQSCPRPVGVHRVHCECIGRKIGIFYMLITNLIQLYIQCE